MAKERPADNFLDVRGKRSNLLFARHKETGKRITSRRFYRLKGKGNEREGYVLMTTAPKFQAEPDKLF